MFPFNIKNYTLKEIIGKGAHSTVYKGCLSNNPSLDFAIKVVDKTSSLDSILLEADLLLRLDHPNIVPLEDYFLYSGKLVLVMKYISGENLKTVLDNRESFNEPEVRNFLIQIGSALDHAHSKNIIHRDVKLNNILLEKPRDGVLKYYLTDFGIGKLSSGVIFSKLTGGTYLYMAPEQIRGRPSYQSDLWSLGVCAYVLITKEYPFVGDNKNQLLKNITYNTPTLPSFINTDLKFELESIILSLLEKHLTHRLLSAQQLLSELKKGNFIVQKVKAPEKIFSFNQWENLQKKRIENFYFRFYFLVIPSVILWAINSLNPFIPLGAWLIYYGQKKGEFVKLYLGVILGIIGLYWRNLVIPYLVQFSWLDLGYILDIFLIFFIYLGIRNLIEARKIEYRIFFISTIRSSFKDTPKIIIALTNFIKINWLDVNLHQKLVEILITQGLYEEAIIEIKQILKVDEYNFPANLSLAYCYYEVGLYDECVLVCDNYLSIIGYCFEFDDLKNKTISQIKN